MPRGPRIDKPGMLHHVMFRGIEKRSIMLDDHDMEELLRRIGRIAEETGTVVYAYALMINHAHLLIRSSESGLSFFMQRLLTGYGRYFNKRHKRVGHVFQNRYLSVVCQDDVYFRTLVGYINLNPVRSGLVPSLHGLATWPWTSHPAVIGRRSVRWLDTESVLSAFGSTLGNARRAYQSFLEGELAQKRSYDFSGGGLIRSVGGSDQLGVLRAKGEALSGDQRILGSSEFVQRTLEDIQRAKGSGPSLALRIEQAVKDIATVAESFGITVPMLSSGGRSQPAVRARRELVVMLVETHGLSHAQIGRLLGITGQSVRRIYVNK